MTRDSYLMPLRFQNTWMVLIEFIVAASGILKQPSLLRPTPVD